MDDTYRAGELIPHKNVRYSFTPRMNHRFTPEFAVTRPLWFDQHLRKTFTFPATPDSRLVLDTGDHVPEFEVAPDSSQSLAEIHIYYSVDPDPRARFWRSASAKRTEGVWKAKLPVLSVERPLFAFANIEYVLKKEESEPFARPTERFAISSMMHSVVPDGLKRAEVKATDKPSSLVDDFAHGWQDWYLLEVGNPRHWEFSTRKVADPKWQGQPGQRLAIDVQTEKTNELVIVLTENYFRSYRGRSQEFVAVVQLKGGKDAQTISLEPKDFRTSDGESLSSWKNIDVLSLRAYYEKNGKLLGGKNWAGGQPKFRKLWWQGS